MTKVKQLKDAAPAMYEALKELEPYIIWLEQNHLTRITSLIKQALTKAETPASPGSVSKARSDEAKVNKWR